MSVVWLVAGPSRTNSRLVLLTGERHAAPWKATSNWLTAGGAPSVFLLVGGGLGLILGILGLPFGLIMGAAGILSGQELGMMIFGILLVELTGAVLAIHTGYQLRESRIKSSKRLATRGLVAGLLLIAGLSIIPGIIALVGALMAFREY